MAEKEKSRQAGNQAAGRLGEAGNHTNQPQNITDPGALVGVNFPANGSNAHEPAPSSQTNNPFAKLLEQGKVTLPQPRRIEWTAGELLRAEFPDPVWAVPGLIPAGLSILAGRPKLGKSWLALQAAVAVGTGGRVLGEQVERRRVLYVALEDSGRRLQDRLKRQGCPADADITVFTEWPSLLEVGLQVLTAKIESDGYTFVIVDTLARWGAARRQDEEMQIAQRLGELQRFAVSQNLAVLLVDHHRKAGAGSVTDVIDDVMGATAKTGVADAALGLYRARGQQGAELKLTGRDVTERELAVQFDKVTFCWQLLGDASAVRSGTLQAALLEVLEESYGGQATCSDLARALGKDRGNVFRELQELLSKGRLTKTAKEGREVHYKLAKGA